jgi:hypothetical protein
MCADAERSKYIYIYIYIYIYTYIHTCIQAYSEFMCEGAERSLAGEGLEGTVLRDVMLDGMYVCMCVRMFVYAGAVMCEVMLDGAGACMYVCIEGLEVP